MVRVESEMSRAGNCSAASRTMVASGSDHAGPTNRSNPRNQPGGVTSSRTDEAFERATPPPWVTLAPHRPFRRLGDMTDELGPPPESPAEPVAPTAPIEVPAPPNRIPTAAPADPAPAAADPAPAAADPAAVAADTAPVAV